MSPTMIVNLSVSPQSSTNFFSRYFEVVMLDTYIFKTTIYLLDELTLYHYLMSFISGNTLFSQSLLSYV